MIQLVVGSVFLHAGWLKVTDPIGARMALLDYRLLPSGAVAIAAPFQALLELIVGAGLIAGVTVTIPFAILLLAAFSLAGLLALIRGLEIDCHCAGEGQKLDIRSLGRSAAFASLLAGALLLSGQSPDPFLPTALAASLPYALVIALLTAAATLVTVSSRLMAITSE